MNLKKVFPIVAMLIIGLVFSCQKEENPGVRPTVVSTNPVTNSTSIAINSKIATTFSVPMDSSTITSSSYTLKKGADLVSGTITYSGTTAMFAPAANLAPKTVYSVSVSTSVKNKNGNSLATDYQWSFTTGEASDITIPAVTLTDPANNAPAVTLNHSVSVTFSKPMNVSTINTFTFTLKQVLTAVSGAVTYTGTMATFTPAGNLEPGKVYTATISTGAMDLTGNALGANYTFSFTTGTGPDTVLPLINSTDPLNNAISIPRNKVVSLTFSEAMDPVTINANTFTVKQGTTVVPGLVAYSGTTATFTPANALTAGTLYTATITTGAKDLAGNALPANIAWSFTTAGSSSMLAVVALGEAGNYVILAKTGISNISTSNVTGDIGLSPAATSYVTGFALTNATGYATSPQITGKIFAADMADPTPINLTTAVNNMLTAYTDAAGRPLPDFSELGTGNIGGKTLVPGLYKWTNNVTMPSDVTISGGANDVWIFQIAGNLIMSSAVKITLNGGAQAKNIFWQVAGQATLGTTSHFEGIILSMTGITFQTGASINGRALAQTAVTLDSNAVTKP